MLAQLVFLKYWNESTAYKNDVYLLPEQLGVQAGILHLTALRAELTGSTQEPADSICAKVEGTFNGEPYCYWM